MRVRAPRLLVPAPLLVFLVVLAWRAAAWAALEGSPLADWHLWKETDEWAALDWSSRIAAGNWLDVPAYRPWFSWMAPLATPAEWDRLYPANVSYQGALYPYLLAAVRRTAGDPVVPVRLAQLLLACGAAAAVAAATAAVLTRAGVSEVSRRAGSVAGGLFHGLYGPLVVLDGTLYRDGPFAHLSALVLAVPLVLGGPPRRRTLVLLGLGGGVAVLLKQTALPLVLGALALLVARLDGRKARVRGAAWAGGALALALLPLVARNVAAGAPALAYDTRLQAGLAWALAQGADGSPDISPHYVEILRRSGGSTLATVRLVAESWHGDVAGFLALEARKLASFFNGVEIADNVNVRFFTEHLPPVRPLPVFACVLGTGLPGLLVAWRRRWLPRGEAALVTLALAVPIASCLLVSVTSRYRASAVPPLALGAGFLVAATVEAGRERRPATVVRAWAAGLALSLQTLLPPPVPVADTRWVDSVVYATLAEARGDPDAGAREVIRYLREGGSDRGRAAGEVYAKAWLAGARTLVRMEPRGLAPPERRFVPPPLRRTPRPG